MYPFIESYDDLKKFENLDYVINSITQIHNQSCTPLTYAILSSVLLNSLEELYQYTFLYRDEYPTGSLIYRLYNEPSFFRLVLGYSSLFFKRDILLEVLTDSTNKFCKVCSHGFSHLHLFESHVSDELLSHDIGLSFQILSNTFSSALLLDSYVSPRNQVTRQLLQILSSQSISSIRISSQFCFLSENHSFSAPLKYVYKVLRRLSQTQPNIFHQTCFKLTNRAPSYLASKSFSLVDSGALIPFPRNSSAVSIKASLLYIKKYIDYCVKNRLPISLWYHPHNLLSSPESSLTLYHQIISYLHSIPSSLQYEFSYL